MSVLVWSMHGQYVVHHLVPCDGTMNATSKGLQLTLVCITDHCVIKEIKFPCADECIPNRTNIILALQLISNEIVDGEALSFILCKR